MNMWSKVSIITPIERGQGKRVFPRESHPKQTKEMRTSRLTYWLCALMETQLLLSSSSQGDYTLSCLISMWWDKACTETQRSVICHRSGMRWNQYPEKIWAGKTRRSLRFSCFNSQHSMCALEVWSVPPSLLLGTWLLTTHAIHQTQSNHVKPSTDVMDVMDVILLSAKSLLHPRDAKRWKSGKTSNLPSNHQTTRQLDSSPKGALWTVFFSDFGVKRSLVFHLVNMNKHP